MEKIQALIDLRRQCECIALRIYPSFKESYPAGVNEMIKLHISDEDLAIIAPDQRIDIKISETEIKLRTLKEMEASLARPRHPEPSLSESTLNSVQTAAHAAVAASTDDTVGRSRRRAPEQSLPQSTRETAAHAEVAAFTNTNTARCPVDAKPAARRSLSVPYPPLPDALRRTNKKSGQSDPEDYWNFCFEQIVQNNMPLGPSKLNSLYTKHCADEGKPCKGFQNWFKNNQELLFLLLDAAKVQIKQGSALHFSLKSHWGRH